MTSSSSLPARNRTSGASFGGMLLGPPEQGDVRSGGVEPLRARLEGESRGPPGRSAWSRRRESRPLPLGCNQRPALAVIDIEQMMGIEPTPRGWQPRARPSSCTCIERAIGIEPTPQGLEDLRTTIALRPHRAGCEDRTRLSRVQAPTAPRVKPARSRLRGLNPSRTAYQAVRLPEGIGIVEVSGVEPAGSACKAKP